MCRPHEKKIPFKVSPQHFSFVHLFVSWLLSLMGENSTFWEMPLFVFCCRAAQTDKNNYIKVVLNSRMNLRRGILHYSEYASIENLILDWKLPKLLQVSSAGQSFCVGESSGCWQIFRCWNSDSGWHLHPCVSLLWTEARKIHGWSTKLFINGFVLNIIPLLGWFQRFKWEFKEKLK